MANGDKAMTGDTPTDVSSDTPRQGRRNALADIFEGLTPATVHELKQFCLCSLSEEDAKRFIDRLDVIQSERFHNRRNALWDLLDFIDSDSLQDLRRRIQTQYPSDSLVNGDTRQKIH
ncbi:hypothetical protein NP493_683g00000 [Ridgeia piscesae]|uniref:Uncharacterized protein n=1 Tax=Ridgeia piscesae TaxID=27915 RepID=A0AAD9KRB8_RIDPI|nr:hypothetical protein NP493_683g00000 [Ridgeia piscesae]